MITVSKNGGGEYTSIAEALKNASENDIIFIKKGIYHEQAELIVNGVTIIGEDMHETVIEYDLYAKMPAPDADKLGTFRSYTLLLNADNVTLKNITVKNTAGFGSDVGQAVALYAEGDNITVEDCILEGHQDTLFTGPLPYKEVEKGGFKGPTEFAERRFCRQYYRRCFISGEVDFIFGSAAVIFEDCELYSIDCGKEINGYVTASSAYEGQPYGYIFRNCRFTGNCPDETVYIGRPWREHAQTVLINCELGSHIHRDIFHDWNKPNAHKTAFYGLYNCCGDGLGTDKPADFVHILSHEDMAQVNVNINMSAVYNHTIEELENFHAEKPELDSYVCSTWYNAVKKPVSQLSAEEIRLLIGQKTGIKHILPGAISILKNDPVIEVTFFEGDLLKQLLDLNESEWSDSKNELMVLAAIIRNDLDRILSCNEISENSVNKLLRLTEI